MSGRLRQIIQILLHMDEPPQRTALAFAIGVFIAFFPILGIHTAIALLIAFAFRLSRVAILLGAYINNPWTLVPLYMAGTAFGCFLLGTGTADFSGINYKLHGWDFYYQMLANLRPLLWPFVIGNLVMGVLSAMVAFIIVRALLERRRRSQTSA
ncbi:MAG: DUF2062 domain-containing protein [Vicinamibacteria bacterium]|jgi:hypothetical protein|nr:DUF2062 domain-containing protein [Vicinamibacteria bacterium]